jgi:hypothetical protein
VVIEIMMTVIMLIYVVSLEFQLPPCVHILNLCSTIKLVSPVYFGNGTVCSKLPDQQIDSDAATRAYFEINDIQGDFEGALLLKLQICPDGQCNMDTSTTETKDETQCVQMLIAWKVNDAKLLAHVALIEHTKEFTWSEDKLKNLYNKNHDHFKEYSDTISETWFINANTVLRTTFNASGLKRTPELSISISEGEKSSCAIGPFCMDPER